MKLKIADNLSLPLDAVTQTFAILAKRRAGKSYTARRFTEQLLEANQQVVIVDPKGDWWGIRSSADGKSPGFPVIVLGGEHGDLPLEATGAEVVAKLAVFERVNLLLDLSSFKKSEVARFMGGELQRAGFLEALYRLKAREEYRSPMMLVVDEADAIAPQKPYKGEERMLGAIEDIVRRGGQRGIGCLLISQRSAVLNKNVLTQTQVLVPMRTISPQDLDAMNAWVDVHGTQEQRKLLMESLPSLPTGDAWFWSPGWPSDEGIFKRVHVSPITTFDSGATPRPGEKLLKPKTLADIDLDAVRRQMAETIEKAKGEDPRELRKQIAGLKAELAERGKFATGQVLKVNLEPQLREAEGRGYERGLAEGRKAAEGIAGQWRRAKELLESQAASGVKVVENIGHIMEEALASAKPKTMAAGAAPSGDYDFSAFAERRALPSAARRAPAQASGQSGLNQAERKILTVLAQRPQGCDVDRLAILSGYTVNGHFNNVLGGLRTKALVTPARVVPIQITAEGLRELGDFEPLPTGKDLQGWWMSKLNRAEQQILGVLLELRGEPIELEELAARAGYTVNGHFTNTIGGLRTKGLMSPARTPIRASEDFFE